MNSYEKNTKKNSLSIKKNNVIFQNNRKNVQFDKHSSNNLVLKTTLASKNEEININSASVLHNNNNEESKKNSVLNKRDTSKSNSSNRILQTLKKDNNLSNLNKYLQTNMRINKNSPRITENHKKPFVSSNSNSNSSNNLLTSNNSTNYKNIIDARQTSENKETEITLFGNNNQTKNSSDNNERDVINIKINHNELPIDMNKIKKTGIIQLNLPNNNVKRDEQLMKETAHFNSVNTSTNNIHNNCGIRNNHEIAMNKKDNLGEKQKISVFEREIAHLKSIVNQKTKDLKEKDRKILLLENKVKSLQKENTNLKEKLKKNNATELNRAYNRIQQLENHLNNENLEISYSDLINRLQTNNISVNEIFGRFPEMREMINQDLLYDQGYNDVFPNPDEMTYEQLLELQEKIGFVEKGFKPEEVEKIPLIKYNKDILKIDKCTVCQFDFVEEEMLRKLTCGHFYHKDCIDEWLLKDKKCPVCKTEVRLI